MPTVGTVARLMVELSAAGVAETGAAVRGVGTSAESSTAKLGLMKRFMGSFLGQQLIFGLISKAIQVISTNIQDIGTKTNAWDADLTQLNAVLASTHGQAGETAQAAISLANAMSQVTLFNNDAVLSTENLLLTFTAIGTKIFPQATQTALDMAQALKEDTKSAAIQLGKALQDPVLGMTALRRVGVNFSKDQIDVVKQMVATGHSAQAQALILQELQKEFGGSAVAAGTTMAGKLQILNNQVDLSKEAIGNALIPVLAQLFGRIAPLATQLGKALPGALQTAGTFFTTYLRIPLLDVKDIVGDVFGALGTLGGAFIGASGKGKSLKTTSGDLHDILVKIGDFIKSPLTPALAGVGTVAGTTAARVVGLTQFLKDHRAVAIGLAAGLTVLLIPAIVAAGIAFYGWAAGIVASTVAMATNPIGLIAVAVALLVTGLVLLVTHWKQVTTTVQQAWKRLDQFHTLIVVMLGPIAWLVAGIVLLVQHWQHVSSVAQQFGSAIGALFKPVGQFLGWLGQITGATNHVGGAFKGLPGIWQGVFGVLWSIAKAPLNLVIAGINAIISGLDSIQVHVPRISVGPVSTPSFDWSGMGIPTIPLLGQGGVVTPGGSAIVGDSGQEMLAVDGQGNAHVMPMLPGARDLSTAKQNGGGDTHIHVHAPASFLTPQQLTASVSRALMLQRGRLGFGH